MFLGEREGGRDRERKKERERGFMNKIFLGVFVLISTRGCN